MYVQVVSYGLAGIGEDDYLDVANRVAPRFSGMPGLLAKLWLGNTEDGRYGAVYLWEDREAMERFVRSDLFEAFNPEFDEVAVEDFDVLENLTAVTQPVLEVLQPKRQRLARTPRPAPASNPPAISSGTSGARKAPVATKAATKAPKKTTPTTAGPAKKVDSRARKSASGATKAATAATRKTAKKTR